uniref:AlNc14C682G12400 protein n=1 Tax=Albugo laibachii Nc14 TaxID=890382 RepID=F0X1T8_9STRA|nr:AlNc14C682G12400 [Albugo laibachii Nc14]|eukprot:CCA27792.1 AlNc14C682G12400 [Albugo laibachii Nc14]
MSAFTDSGIWSLTFGTFGQAVWMMVRSRRYTVSKDKVAITSFFIKYIHTPYVCIQHDITCFETMISDMRIERDVLENKARMMSLLYTSSSK